MSSETQPLPLDALQLPQPPSWFPLAWGWWASVGVVFVTLIAIWLLLRWNKKRLAPKKTALRLLAMGDRPSEAIELVRQAALCYFPREEIAQLTGKEWYQFLDSQLATPCFADNYDRWQNALYNKQSDNDQAELITHCQQWVEQALPPKRGRAVRG